MAKIGIIEIIEDADKRMYAAKGRYLRITEKASLAFLILEERLFGDEKE